MPNNPYTGTIELMQGVLLIDRRTYRNRLERNFIIAEWAVKYKKGLAFVIKPNEYGGSCEPPLG